MHETAGTVLFETARGPLGNALETAPEGKAPTTEDG